MTKFVVIGAPGRGKTTMARALAEKGELGYVEPDAILHGSGGIEPSNDDFCDAVLPRLEGEAWVVDMAGTSGSSGRLSCNAPMSSSSLFLRYR